MNQPTYRSVPFPKENNSRSAASIADEFNDEEIQRVREREPAHTAGFLELTNAYTEAKLYVRASAIVGLSRIKATPQGERYKQGPIQATHVDLGAGDEDGNWRAVLEEIPEILSRLADL